MSTVKEKADLEATLAENELDDAEAERIRELVGEGASPDDALATVIGEREAEAATGVELDPEEEETGQPSPERIEALRGAMEEHERRVRQIMGPFLAGFDTCGACNGIGLSETPPPPPANPLFKRCDTCLGTSQVSTGSLNPNHAMRDCPACRGRGYLERVDNAGGAVAPMPGAQPEPMPAPAPAAAVASAAPAEENGGGEQWGVPSWMGDPNVGA